ncbi:leucine-rich repeat protein [Apibacter sp. wkB309]|uniref:leucine-rich repeat protein n=1 Tax=Apibacter sp. wkB309 TaxID=1679467 RepID=UPI000CF9DF1E|nr:leucine-rich repeat protein [Apibacter sp. wkB309]PQL92977.1 hypothetical protein C4S75_01480 [Apibacter sp. wkB309]
MKKFIFFMLSIFLIGAVCHAQVYKELDVKSPGTLSQLVTSDKSKITHLKLTGSISNEDIKTIREMSALNNLDLTKVKLSDNNLPKGAFSNFKGHISLPATLKVIPSNTFISYSGSITLPSALETIEHKAFLAAKIDKLDFSNIPNLHTIDYSAFEGLTLTTTNNTLDFSKNLKLNSFLPYGSSVAGPFTGFVGNVILPTNLKKISNLMFAQFTGSITLPAALETIEHKAFIYSKIDKLDFSNSPNLNTINYSAFERLTLTKTNNTLDFSKNLKLNSFLPYGNAVAGPFTGFVGNVILPTNLKEISNLMFSQFTGSVILPYALETIEHKAFMYSKIDKLDFSNSPNLSTIKDRAFEALEITSNNNTLDFSKNLKLTSFISNPGTNSGAFTPFNGNVILPPNLKEIPNLMFSQFTGSVTLPSSLETIEHRAFLFAKIDKLDFSNTPNLNTIKNRAFESLQITSNNNTLDFSTNLKLTSFISNSGTNSGAFTPFNGNVILPPNLKEIPNLMFSQFTGSVTLPAALETIENRAFLFAKVDKLDFFSTPNLNTIKDNAFEGLQITTDKTLNFVKNLKLKSFPSHHNSASGAFSNYSGHVILPINLTRIYSYMFSKFNGSVCLPVALRVIDNRTFYYANIDRLDFCKSIILTEIKERAFEKLNLTENKTLDFSKNCQLNTFSSNPGTNSGSFTLFTGNVILPQHLKQISTLTFSQFTGSVTLPPALETIEDKAFIYAKMKEIVIPSTVNYIGNSAFMGNTTFEKIISNNPTPPRLGKEVFKSVNTTSTRLIANTCAYAEADQWKDFIKNADLVACGKKANFAFNNYLTTEPQINVYPNPNNGLFSINLGNISEGSIEISNINGGIIYSKKFNGINEIYVDIQTQPSGIYIVNVISNQTVITKKIIKN